MGMSNNKQAIMANANIPHSHTATDIRPTAAAMHILYK